MTREMAVLGIPTISVYQDRLLEVDKFLQREGAFLHKPALTVQETLDLLGASTKREPNQALLQKGREAYRLIRDEVLRQ